MADTPELDQVAEARRRLATHAAMPPTYWAVQTIAVVLIAGIPLWLSFLPAVDGSYVQWVLLAVAAAAAAYAGFQRRRSGVYLPRRISAYPSARLAHIAVLIVMAAGVVGVYALVSNGHPVLAFVTLIAVAAASLIGHLRIRAAMRRDIEDGRVSP